MEGQIEKISRPEQPGKGSKTKKGKGKARRPTWLLIDGQWYSTFHEVPFSEGDWVRFEFEVKRRQSDGRSYRNITKLIPLKPKQLERDVSDQGEDGGGDSDLDLDLDPEVRYQSRRMLRAVALKAAVQLSEDPGEVIHLANLFYDWLVFKR